MLGYFSGSSKLLSPFQRTVTFTLTSLVNITSVQSCIPATLFSNAAAQATNCRRKREDDEDIQFPITPSETQQQ